MSNKKKHEVVFDASTMGGLFGVIVGWMIGGVLGALVLGIVGYIIGPVTSKRLVGKNGKIFGGEKR